MRILHLHEAAFPVQSSMRNAVFSFAEMTTSIVAVRVDPGRGGSPVTGYAFNSTGRYACGQAMRDRFFPRLLRAAPESLLDAGGVLDPAQARSAMLVGEKPGGHAERSIPVGTIETDPAGAPINGATMLPTSIGICHQRAAHAFTPSVFHESAYSARRSAVLAGMAPSELLTR